MAFVAPPDALFLMAETRDHPMHIGAVGLWVPPPEAGDGFAREIYEEQRANTRVSARFRRRPAHLLPFLDALRWTVDDDIDLDYHVRLWSLPKPGEIRELFELVSRLHESPLDRHQPLWEYHVIDGLADGRVAIYQKVHHALIDGVASMRLTIRQLSPDPTERNTPAYWAPVEPPPGEPNSPATSPVDVLHSVAGATVAAGQFAVDAVKVADSMRKGDLADPMPSAPRTILNTRVGSARRFAAQSWSIDRLRAVARRSDTTLNDVVLAMCGGALRTYLLDLDALPLEPLIAAVPVSVRSSQGSGGNAVSALLCNLATDDADADRRLAAIASSMRRGKEALSGLSPLSSFAVGGLAMHELLLAQIPGYAALVPPAFNVVISNVPGPTETMYLNGARLDGIYPTSIVMDGQALNITVTNHAGYLDFGLIGDRKRVPHLQRLLAHLENALVALEKGVNLP